MTDFLPVAGRLPASKTHKERGFTFVPTAEPMKPGIGVLTLTGGRREIDSYAIETADIGRGCAQVLFVKKDDVAEIYAVTCTPTGVPIECTCPGHFFGKKKDIVCKHVAAVRELLADGVLELRPTTLPA